MEEGLVSSDSQVDVASLLIEKGADVNARNNQKASVIYIAAKHGQEKYAVFSLKMVPMWSHQTFSVIHPFQKPQQWAVTIFVVYLCNVAQTWGSTITKA
jgi:hypothetical protein